MCCRACCGYALGKAGKVDFFDGETWSGALINGFGPRYTRTACRPVRGRGSISMGVTLRVPVESKACSTKQTSPRQGSSVPGMGHSYLPVVPEPEPVCPFVCA
jgi:hypothetical protein